jgi:hypothetical protein
MSAPDAKTFRVAPVFANDRRTQIAWAVGRYADGGGWRETASYKLKERAAADACTARLNAEAVANRARA